MSAKYTHSPRITLWRNIFYTTRNYRVLKHIESSEICNLGKLPELRFTFKLLHCTLIWAISHITHKFKYTSTKMFNGCNGVNNQGSNFCYQPEISVVRNVDTTCGSRSAFTFIFAIGSCLWTKRLGHEVNHSFYLVSSLRMNGAGPPLHGKFYRRFGIVLCPLVITFGHVLLSGQFR